MLYKVVAPKNFKNPLRCLTTHEATPIQVYYARFKNSAKIFTTIVNCWKLLAIVIKSSGLDFGGGSGSTAGRE